MFVHVRRIEKLIKEYLHDSGYEEDKLDDIISYHIKEYKKKNKIMLVMITILYSFLVLFLTTWSGWPLTIVLATIIALCPLYLLLISKLSKILCDKESKKSRKAKNIKIEYNEIKEDIDAIRSSFDIEILRYDYTIEELTEIIKTYKMNYKPRK